MARIVLTIPSLVCTNDHAQKRNCASSNSMNTKVESTFSAKAAIKMMRTRRLSVGLGMLEEALSLDEKNTNDVFSATVPQGSRARLASLGVADQLLEHSDFLTSLCDALKSNSFSHAAKAVRVSRLVLEQCTSVTVAESVATTLAADLLQASCGLLERDLQWDGVLDVLAALHASSIVAGGYLAHLGFLPAAVTFVMHVICAQRSMQEIIAALALVSVVFSDDEVRTISECQPYLLHIKVSKLHQFEQWLSRTISNEERLRPCRSAAAAALRATARLIDGWGRDLRNEEYEEEEGEGEEEVHHEEKEEEEEETMISQDQQEDSDEEMYDVGRKASSLRKLQEEEEESSVDNNENMDVCTPATIKAAVAVSASINTAITHARALNPTSSTLLSKSSAASPTDTRNNTVSSAIHSGADSMPISRTNSTVYACNVNNYNNTATVTASLTSTITIDERSWASSSSSSSSSSPPPPPPPPLSSLSSSSSSISAPKSAFRAWNSSEPMAKPSEFREKSLWSSSCDTEMKELDLQYSSLDCLAIQHHLSLLLVAPPLGENNLSSSADTFKSYERQRFLEQHSSKRRHSSEKLNPVSRKHPRDNQSLHSLL